MQQFFFDYKTKDRSLLDYHGQRFHNTAGATKFAHEIVQDLKHSLSADWAGWSVEVRSANGEKILSLPVESELLSAA